MDKSELMINSIYKNIQELAEFCAYDLGITNYYDLVDYIIDLHNFRARVYKENKPLAQKIIKELEEEDEE